MDAYPLTTQDRTESKRARADVQRLDWRRGAGNAGGRRGHRRVGLVVAAWWVAAVGTALAGLTGNRDLDIPAESVVRFKLADDLVVQPAQ